MSVDGLNFFWNKDVLVLRPEEQIEKIKANRQEKDLEEEKNYLPA